MPLSPAYHIAGRPHLRRLLAPNRGTVKNYLNTAAEATRMSTPELVSTATPHGTLVHTGQPAPALLLIHAWWGLNDFFKSFAADLATNGYTVLAPDLYGGQIATTPDEAEALRAQLKGPAVEAQLRTAFDYLITHPLVNAPQAALIGFSLGARYALSLAEQRPKQIAAVVVYYGTRPGSYELTQAAVLGHFAHNDVYTSRRQTRTLEKALTAQPGRTVAFYDYPDTEHWFAERDRRNAYDPDAADLAWSRTLAFLAEQLSVPASSAR